MVRLLLLYSLVGHSQYPKDIEAIMWRRVLHMLLTLGRAFVLAPAFRHGLAERIARHTLFFLRASLQIVLVCGQVCLQRDSYLFTLPSYFKCDTSNV